MLSAVRIAVFQVGATFLISRVRKEGGCGHHEEGLVVSEVLLGGVKCNLILFNPSRHLPSYLVPHS